MGHGVTSGHFSPSSKGTTSWVHYQAEFPETSNNLQIRNLESQFFLKGYLSDKILHQTCQI